MTVKKIVGRKNVFLLIFLCGFAYFVSYLTRYNYAAVQVAIMETEGFSKSAVSLPVTAMFITYGIGQLISGYLGDKFKPEYVVFAGLTSTALCNALLPLCTTTSIMTVVWGFNGFAQALMWPPIVKILTGLLTKDSYEKNIVYVLFGTAFGTIFVYLFSPIIITVSDWKPVFFIPAAIAVVTAFFWLVGIKRLRATMQDVEIYAPASAKPGQKLKFTHAAIGLFILIMFVNIAQGFLRDGTQTWMPTYMREVFKLDTFVAILTGVALPIASKILSFFTNVLHRRVFKNEALTNTVFFIICTACCFVLCFANNASPVLSVSMFMIANASTHAINYMYTTIVVTHFERFGRASFVAGLINSFVYIGSALSTFGIAFITESTGWTGTMICLAAVSVIGLVVSIISIKPFKKPL